MQFLNPLVDETMEPASVAAPARRARRREARPHEILDAALSIFVEKGFSAARTEDIAKRAGITKGTLYLYFASKEEIFKSLLRESFAPRISQFGKVIGNVEAPSADVIRLAVRSLGQFMRHSNHAALPKLILAEIGNFPDLALFYKDQVIDPGLGMLEAIIRRGIERGEFRPVDPKYAARLVMIPVSFTGIWRSTFGRLEGETLDYEALLEAHLDLVLRGLAAGENA